MLQPAGPQVAPPVLLHPAADGGFSQVPAGFFTLDPPVFLGFLFPIDIHACFLRCRSPLTAAPPSAMVAVCDPPCPTIFPDNATLVCPGVQVSAASAEVRLVRRVCHFPSLGNLLTARR